MAKIITNASGYASGTKIFNPNWQPLYGGGSSTYDAFHSQKAPNPVDLVRAYYSDVIYSCTTLIAQTISQVKLRLYAKTMPGQRAVRCLKAKVDQKNYARLAKSQGTPCGAQIEEVLDHPVLKLLKKSNATHNQVDLIELISLYMEHAGSAYLLMEDDVAGRPCELYLLPSQHVYPERESTLKVRAWKYGVGTETKEYLPEHIIHFKYQSLDDPYVSAVSPVRAAWQRLQISLKEQGYLDSVLSNSGRPDSIISVSEGMFPTEMERLNKEFFQRYRGGGAGGPMLVDGKMSFAPISWPPTDLAALELYRVVKLSVCNCFQIPLDILEPGEANRATADTSRYLMALHCIRPRINRIVEKFNERLVSLFDDDRLFLAHDEVVPEDQDYELRKVQLLSSTGAWTRNQVRIWNGEAPEVWGDTPLLPSGMMPAPVATVNDDVDSEQLLLPAMPPSQSDLNARSTALVALQQAVYSGTMPRAAAISNAVISLGLDREQAEELFPAEEKEEPDHQAEVFQSDAPVDGAAASGSADLRATVGGSTAVAELQRSYYRGDLPRVAAIANAVLIFGFTEAEAARLFPDIPPNPPSGGGGEPAPEAPAKDAAPSPGAQAPAQEQAPAEQPAEEQLSDDDLHTSRQAVHG